MVIPPQTVTEMAQQEECILVQLGVLEVEYTDSVDVAVLVVEHTHSGEARARGAGHILFGQVGWCLEMKYM